jgi:hypothetical protein
MGLRYLYSAHVQAFYVTDFGFVSQPSSERFPYQDRLIVFAVLDG